MRESGSDADLREQYFARVLPVLGRGLEGRVVEVEGLGLLGRVVEMLVSCRLETVRVARSRRRIEPAAWPLTRMTDRPAGARGPDTARRRMRDHLAWKNGFVPVRWRGTGPADLKLRALLDRRGGPGRIDWDESHARITMHVPDGDDDSWRDLSNTVARVARDLLMGRSAWPCGTTLLGHPLWPWAPETVPGKRHRVPFSRPSSHVMVVGLGSIGSEVVRALRPRVARWTLVDGARVSVHNPQRQWFGTTEIGALKVEALRRRLGEGVAARTLARSPGAADTADLEALLECDRPDLVILSTGTRDDLALAEVLRRRDIPHVIAYAYPRARFFEVSVVLPGTPCLSCWRGHLYRGPASALPVPDEVGAMLYAMPSGEGRDLAFTELVAEPATAIETGRLVDVVARCARELLAPAGRRSPWFRRMLAEETTCLIGGNVVEIREDGEAAYGLTFPGQVVRLGLEDIVGIEEHPVCGACGRRLTARFRVDLPAVDGDDADRGMLATP